MSGDNGKTMPQEEPKDKILIQIIQRADGQLELKSSLQPPFVVYLFEELKARMFAPKQESPILKAPGGIMNFVRGGMRK